MASAVYMAPEAELSTATMASFGFDCGAHPLMVPSKVAKRKMAGHPCTEKSGEPLKTIPVGWPGPLPDADGTTTFNPFSRPVPV